MNNTQNSTEAGVALPQPCSPSSGVEEINRVHGTHFTLGQAVRYDAGKGRGRRLATITGHEDGCLKLMRDGDNYEYVALWNPGDLIPENAQSSPPPNNQTKTMSKIETESKPEAPAVGRPEGLAATTCSPSKWTFATAKGAMPSSHTGAVHWVSDRQQAIEQAIGWGASTLIEMDDRGRVIRRTAIKENARCAATAPHAGPAPVAEVVRAVS